MTDPSPAIGLTIDVPEASPGEIKRGIEAAWKVLNDAGFTAWEAASAAFHQEAIDHGSGQWKRVTERDRSAAEAWREANRQAIVACCAGWQEVPDTARLELDYNREA